MFVPNIKDEAPVVLKSGFEQDTPDQEMFGIRLYESSESKQDWVLKAERARAVKSGTEWSLNKVNVIFYAKNNLQYTVKGNLGVLNIESKDMLISGDVSVITTNGYLMETPELQYSSSKKVFEALSQVKVFSPKDKNGKNIKIEAEKLNVDLATNDLSLKGNVISQRSLGSFVDLQILSDKVLLKSSDNTGEFFPKVAITYNKKFIPDLLKPHMSNSTLSGGPALLKFDKKNNLETLQVSDGVEFSEFGKNATADTVVVNFLEKSFRLIGQPRLMQQGEELIGDEIIFKNDGKTIEIKGAKAHIKDGGMVLDE